jgi:DNA-directed RNA polymerase subunit RPC12/RpoP
MNSFSYRFILLPRHCELCGRRFWFAGYRSVENQDRWRCPDCQRRQMWGFVMHDLRRVK